MTQAPATPELVERLRSPEWGEFRSVSSHVLCQQAAAALEAQQARIAELEAKLSADDAEHDATETDRDIWHEIADERLAKLKASQALADRYEKALREIYRVGDGYGPNDPPKNFAGTTGEGHARCREIARQALSSQGRHEGGD